MVQGQEQVITKQQQRQQQQGLPQQVQQSHHHTEAEPLMFQVIALAFHPASI